jgi:hypothetical protein
LRTATLAAIWSAALHGGEDAEAAGLRLGAVAVLHRLAHHLGDVGRFQLDLRLVRAGMRRPRRARRFLRGGDEAGLAHALQHVVAADDVARGLMIGFAEEGNLGVAASGRRLGQAQLVERLAEVVLGRRRHAVGAVAEEDLVEVQLEDLVLGQLALHLQRQQHLHHLAAVAVFGAEVEVLRDLLGDGAAAGHARVVGGGQQPDRAADAAEIQALVLVEARVLDGDEGLLDVQRDLLDLDRVAARLAELCDEHAVARIDAQGHLQGDMPQLLHVGRRGRSASRGCRGPGLQGRGRGRRTGPGGAASG